MSIFLCVLMLYSCLIFVWVDKRFEIFSREENSMMINGANVNEENISAEGLTYREEQTLEKIAMIKNMLDDPFIRMYISDSYYHKSHLNEAIETLRKIENNILETAYKRRRGYRSQK